jgi:HEAT repeat protein
MTPAELTRMLESDEPAGQLVRAINGIGDPAWFEALGALLAGHASEALRLRGAETLARAGNPEALAALAHLLADQRGAVRAQALYAIFELGGDATEAEAIGRLLLHDPEPRVRANAALALAITRTPEACRLLDQAADDPDTEVRDQVRRQRALLG